MTSEEKKAKIAAAMAKKKEKDGPRRQGVVNTGRGGAGHTSRATAELLILSPPRTIAGVHHFEAKIIEVNDSNVDVKSERARRAV